MKRDCPIVLNECPGRDSPITNASSEAPDPILFAGIGWDLYDPYRPIPLGDGPYVQTDCSNITWSAESQAMADLLAFINAQYCEPPTPPPIPGVPPLPAPFPVNNTNPFSRQPTPPVFPETPTRQFTNDRQYAQVSCPDGAIFEMAVEAGTVVGGPFPEAVGQAWVEYINAYLLAWILQQLYDARVCLEVPGLDDRTPPGTPPTPPPGPGGTPSTFSSHPGWCCLGSALVESQNTYNISGGSDSAIWTFSVSSGSLAPGTTLIQTGPRSAVVSGTPTVAGLYSYTILATSGSSSISVSETLHVFGLVSNALPDGQTGFPYSEVLLASGGTAPITFSGTAPTGLTLASDGTISGTPSAGNYSFAVTITDSGGATCTSDVSITIGGCPPTCSPDSGSAVPTTLLVAVGPITIGTAIVTAANGVGNEVYFPATTDIGAYRINYLSGWFENNVIWPCGDLGIGKRTSTPGFGPNIISSHGAFPGAIVCPPAGGDPSAATLALNPMAVFNDLSGVSVALWSDVSMWGCCNVEDHTTTGSISYEMEQTHTRLTMPTRLRDVCWAETLAALGICAACNNATIEPVWDGTFPYVDDSITSIAWWADSGFGTSPLNLNGKKMYAYIQYVGGAGAYWNLQIYCPGRANPIWRGRKLVGDSPVGHYMKFDPFPGYLCASGPDCIKILSY